MMENTFSLKKNAEFGLCFKKGRVASGRLFTTFVLPNGLSNNRLGISVSKKVAKSAVVRNRLRRRTKEAYRGLAPRMHQDGHDIVVIPKPEAITAGFAEIVASLTHLLKRQGLCK